MNIWEIICVTCGLAFVGVLLTLLAICWVKAIDRGQLKIKQEEAEGRE